MAFVSLIDLVYPVGSYYISNTSTAPSTSFGGTWTQVSDNRYLRGGTSTATGGSNTHTLTAAQLPKNIANIPFRRLWQDTSLVTTAIGVSGDACTSTAPSWSGTHDVAANTTFNSCHYDYVKIAGSGSAHNNEPLYRTCYMWYRTA